MDGPCRMTAAKSLPFAKHILTANEVGIFRHAQEQYFVI